MKKIVISIIFIMIIILIYLNMNIKTYEVKFDSVGGSNVDSIIVKKGTIINLPIPQKENCEFIAWTINEIDVKDILKVEENVTLKATWKRIK